MATLLSIYVFLIPIFSGIDLEYLHNDILITNDSKCNLYFENNVSEQSNILDSTRYALILNSDLLRIIGKINDHHFESEWYLTSLVKDNPVSIIQNDSVFKEKIPINISSTEKYFKMIKIQIGEAVYQEYYWNNSISFFIDGN